MGTVNFQHRYLLKDYIKSVPEVLKFCRSLRDFYVFDVFDVSVINAYEVNFKGNQNS